MRATFALVAGVLAAPAAAQTAVTMDFRQAEVPASGAQVRSLQGFTEFRHGIWHSPQADPKIAAEAEAAVASTLDTFGSVPQVEAASVGVVPPVAAPDSSDPCIVSQVPRYIVGLSRQLVLRRLSWWPVVSATECRYGLPPGLLDAVILQESRYQTGAISPKGAIGLAQLMPGTARELGVANAYDPVGNIDGGARYLRTQLDRFQAVHLGVAAYNAGPGAVKAAGRIPRNGETPEYVRRVLDYWSGAIDDPLKQVRRTAIRLGFLDSPVE
jgi:hypothetical protein